MKNLFFYSNIPLEDKSSGIRNKVIEQIDCLIQMEYDVYYSGYTNRGVAIVNKGQIVEEKVFEKTKGILEKPTRRKELLNFVSNFFRASKVHFEISYIRFHYFDKHFNLMLKTMSNNNSKVIVEAHGYPVLSYKKISNYPMLLLHNLYWRKGSTYIDIVAAISNVDNIWGKKTVFIDNAVNIESYQMLPKKLIGDKIKIIGVANERDYHGYKKIITGLNRYNLENPKREYEIDFLGTYQKSTIELVEELNLTNSIRFLGKVKHGELNQYFNKADLGLGSFGPRAGGEFGSSIKTKEYFAYGLPFLNGWKEYAFDDTYPYVKRFSVYDDTVDFDAVDTFLDSLVGKEDEIRRDMRTFAENNFTWKSQFQKVFGEL